MERFAAAAGSKGMDASESEGLGVSVAIYLAAIVGTLVLVATPVYLANAPKAYENPPLARANPLLNGPIIGNRASSGLPVALLKREDIVDPATLAVLNAKAKKAATASTRHTTHRTAQRSGGTPVADLQPERRRSAFFLFNLFGG